MRFVLAIALLLACTAAVSRADSVRYVILGPSPQADCTFATPGTYSVWAYVDLSQPARYLEISQRYATCNANFSWSYPVSGDPNSLLTVDFGACISGEVLLFSATIQVANCCPALVHGSVVDGNEPDNPPFLIGCDGSRRVLIPPCSAAEPQLVSPSDGVTVSTTPALSWTGPEPSGFCEEWAGVPLHKVYYGTDPSHLDQSTDWGDMYSHSLLALQPNTTYYWQVWRWDGDFGYYTGSEVNVSEIRSFTTDTTTSVHPSTWGYVKSLYRE